MKVALFPDLEIENWKSMDLYAERLAALLPELSPDAQFRLVRMDASTWIDRYFKLPYLNRAVNDRFYSRYLLYPRAVAQVQAAFRPDVSHILDHSYAHLLRRLDKRRTIVTVHDLYPYHLIRSATMSARAQARKRLLQWVMGHLRHAAHLIADSQFTKSELLAFSDYPEERISVVPLGADHLVFEPLVESQLVSFRQRIQIPATSSFILHVGSCDERKNIPCLLRAFTAARKQGGGDLYLLQIGGRFTSDQWTLIHQLGIGDRIRQVRSISARELACAYQACDLLVLPSTYEGFGLSALEAMAAGKPVVALRAGALTELVGDGGVLVEVNDPQEVARAVIAILSSVRLREDLSQKAKQRAALFTWRKTTSETLAIYHRIAEASTK